MKKQIQRATLPYLLLSLFTIFTVQINAKTLSDKEIANLEQLKATALESNLSYDIVESLSTEVGHRLVGSAGDKKSIAWAVNKMKSLGFDKVWTEPVQASFWQRGEANAEIIAPYRQKMVVLALGGSVGTSKKGITANVAHFKTLADLKAIDNNSLNGKIAFVSYKMSQDIDGSDYGSAVGTRVNGAAIAAEKGASALIMRSVGTDNNRLAHTGIMRYRDGVKKIPALALSNPDADLLLRQLQRTTNVSFHLKVTNVAKPKKIVETANVIGEFTGSETPEQIVALGAHLDSWDVGTGAVDDGLGIAMTMAAAYHIGQLPKRPKRTIRVILFGAEEVGLLGAKAYVEKHKADISQHSIGAEWDFGTGRIYKMTPGVGAMALNNIRELASYLAPLGVAIAEENNGRAQSDMGALSDQGMPSINFAPDGFDYFDYHHTENDTLDKVDAKALKVNTAIYTLFAYFSAQSSVDFRK